MDFNELKELVELFSKSNIDRFELNQEGLSLRLAKKKDKITVAAPPPTSSDTSFPPAPAPRSDMEIPDSHVAYVTSPIVGTFYQAPSPTSPPFVQVGDTIHPGQTLCIVEAMKLLNEIQAEQNGVITEVLVTNGQGVEFGQRLFALRVF